MKTELLVQMDGLAKTDDLVFLLAASNLPWYVLFSTRRQLGHRARTVFILDGLFWVSVL